MRIVIRLSGTVRKLKTTLPPRDQATFEQCLDRLGRSTQCLPDEVDFPVRQCTRLLLPGVGCLVVHRQEQRGILGQTLWVRVEHLVPDRELDAFVSRHWLACRCGGDGGGSADDRDLGAEVAIAALDNAGRFDLVRKLAIAIVTIGVIVLGSVGARFNWQSVSPISEGSPAPVVEQREGSRPSQHGKD